MGSHNRPPERHARFGDSPFPIFKNQLAWPRRGLPVWTILLPEMLLLFLRAQRRYAGLLDLAMVWV
jgi:hypothetical protein